MIWDYFPWFWGTYFTFNDQDSDPDPYTFYSDLVGLHGLPFLYDFSFCFRYLLTVFLFSTRKSTVDFRESYRFTFVKLVFVFITSKLNLGFDIVFIRIQVWWYSYTSMFVYFFYEFLEGYVLKYKRGWD